MERTEKKPTFSQLRNTMLATHQLEKVITLYNNANVRQGKGSEKG